MTEACSELRPDLRISLLGPFHVEIEGRPMGRVRSHKEQWLLALLILRHGREVSREWLAETLWPDSRLDQSRAYLRQSLYLLKRAMGTQAPRFQSPTVHSLRLDLNGADVDLVAFDAAIARGDAASLQAALALYQGPFLEGCAESWAEDARRIREHSLLQALEQVAEIERALGRRREACSLLQRLIRHDPLRESAHRTLMETLADAGDYAAMTTAYRALRILLRQEVNSDPSPESIALYEQLRTRSQRPSEPRPAAEAAPDLSLAGTPSRRDESVEIGRTASASDPFVPGAAQSAPLPRPLTPLIGRLEVVQEIMECLQTARMVTLTGTGGVGKTRLALQLAQEWSQRGDVWFVELAALSNPAFLAQAVATACQLAEEPGRALEETLGRHLANHPGLLLVLDNCEHLLGACATLVGTLLHVCPELRLLATSRQALGIVGETLFPVPTLEMPPDAMTPETGDEAAWLSRLHDYEAIRLFEERARAVTPGFRLTGQNAAAVLETCRHLDGIPLAIELAAAWVSVLTPEQMLARVAERRFDLLVSRRRDSVVRHRSLWATLDGSSQLLEPELRHFLACLSVFRGGWTLEAAEAVCLPLLSSSSPPLPTGRALEFLALLQERSLIKTAPADGAMRYSLLESVREYASELLTAAERETLSQAHAACFLALAEEAAPHLIGPQQVRWLDRLEEEQYNMRTALGWCAPQAEETGLRLSIALWRFWDVRGHHQEGTEWLCAFLSRDAAAPESLRARGREAAGLLYAGMLKQATAHQWSLEALEIYTALGDSLGIARTLCTLGISEMNLLQVESARTRLETCLPIVEQEDNAYERGRTLGALGMLEQYTGAFEPARLLLQQAVDSYRACGDWRAVALTLYRLGGIALVHKQFAQARSQFAEALALSREVKDRITLPFGLFHLGQTSLQQNDFASARLYLGEAIAYSRANRNSAVEGTCLVLLGDMAAQEQDIGAACASYIEALDLYNQPETSSGVHAVAARLAPLALRQHQAADALRLYAYASLTCTPVHRQDFPRRFLLYMSLGYLFVDREPFEADLAALRLLLKEAFQPIWDEAQKMTPTDGVHYMRSLAQQLSCTATGGNYED